MKTTNYFFQKRSFAKKFLRLGLTCSSSILLHLSEAGEAFIENLPNDARFASVKWLLKDSSTKNNKQQFSHEAIRKNLHRLQKQGLITQDKLQKSYTLTERGKKIVSYTRDYYSILKKPWDKKFRIVIFDIPEQKRNWRRSLRWELNLMQYVQLQKSVYIGKHPLSKSFLKEIDEANIGEHVFIFTVNQIERKEFISKLFDF
ncbi:MAG: hypothetical protein Q8N55_02440 [bacterium]|nr:hypothetical protein [bacterium]